MAALLPVDPWRREVVLIEQFRPGAMAAGWDPWLLECVAGIIEAGEEPGGVAVRECQEETGLATDRVELLCRYLTSPGACSETVHLFAGRVDASAAGGTHGLAIEGEDIRVQPFSIDEVLGRLRDGAIVNSKTIIALQWLEMHMDALIARWTE